MTKHTFSDKRDVTGAFPISSRRANDGDWKLFDIHDDVSETLSACSRSIFREDEYEIREVPTKGKKIWENEGRKQNRELEPENEEQENKRQSEEREESQADKTLDQSGVSRREQAEEQGQKTVERESQERKESQEDKSPNQSEVPGREQVEGQEHEQHREVPEMTSKGRKQLEQNEDSGTVFPSTGIPHRPRSLREQDLRSNTSNDRFRSSSFGSLSSTASHRSPSASRLGLLNRRSRNAFEDTWNDDLIIP